MQIEQRLDPEGVDVQVSRQDFMIQSDRNTVSNVIHIPHLKNRRSRRSNPMTSDMQNVQIRQLGIILLIDIVHMLIHEGAMMS